VHKDPAKRSQHVNKIVRRNTLRAFGQSVATCCGMMGVVGSNLIIFKLEPTAPNVSQRIPIGWSKARNILRPTILRNIALACWHRLAGDQLYVLLLIQNLAPFLIG